MTGQDDKVICDGVLIPADIYRDVMDRVQQIVEEKNPTIARSVWLPKAEKKLARLVFAMRQESV